MQYITCGPVNDDKWFFFHRFFYSCSILVFACFYTVLLGWFHSNWRNNSWGFTGFAAAQIWRCGAQYSWESSQRDVHWEGSISQDFICCDTFLKIRVMIYSFNLKVLTEISQMWTRMEFSYEAHYRTATPMLKCSDELIESLEDSQV